MKDSVITVSGLTKQYMKQKCVDNVSFEIPRGSICGLIGPNGAGKTTIMKMLGGLVIPTEGVIDIFGETSEKGLAHSRSRMSFIIETPYAKPEMSARDNLIKQCYQKGVPDFKRIDEVLELTGIANTGKKAVKKFSLGMKQRLGIAGALLTKPEIMVLDEPINGLDPEGIVEIRELILKLNREEHITILISSHILSELSLTCTDYIFIQHGKIKRCIGSEELSRLCRRNYHIHTDDDNLAAAILHDKLGITDMEISRDGSICVHERLDETKLISETLFKNGVVPLILEINEEGLEKFYMDMAGEDND